MSASAMATCAGSSAMTEAADEGFLQTGSAIGATFFQSHRPVASVSGATYLRTAGLHLTAFSGMHAAEIVPLQQFSLRKPISSFTCPISDE